VSDLAREWETSSDPERMLQLHPPGPGRKGRLLLVACCRLCGERLAEGSRRAVEVGERWADGLATVAERRAAQHWADAASLTANMRHQTLYHHLTELEALGTPDSVQAARLRDEFDRQTWVLQAAMTALATVFDQPGPDDFRRAIQLLNPAFAAALLRDIFGSSFRPVFFSPEWRTDTVLALARTMYASREFGAMPILADALQDAGCDSEDILGHCRDVTLPHVRGCWVIDLVLGKG
jgi:hypothetical protein